MATPQGIGAGIAPQVGQEPAMQPGAAGAPPQPSGDQSNVTPEEQAQYDQFVRNAVEIIYPEDAQGQMSPALAGQLQGQFDEQSMQMLQGVEPPLDPANPLDNIAGAAVLICLYLDASASQAGFDIDDDIMFNGGAEVVEILASDGEAMGFFDVDDQQTEQAFYRACDIFRTVSPRVDQNMLADQFQEIVSADQQGKLAQLLPNLPGER